jgi:hypothetical protein
VDFVHLLKIFVKSLQPLVHTEVIREMNFMKRRVWITLVLAVAFVSAFAQESENRKVTTFSGVKASEGIDVYLKKGSKEEVRVVASGLALSNVITEVSGGYLKIHLKDGEYRNATIKVYATYVAINKLSASSGATIFHEGILKTNDLSLGASSAGSIELQAECKTIEASASSAGEVEVKGKATSVSFDVSSAGEISAYELTCDKAEAEASGGASIKLSVTNELNAHASSGGSVRYRGNPERSNTNASSGGSVRKAN